MNGIFARSCCIAGAALLLGACTASAHISSNVTQDANRAPRRMFVASHLLDLSKGPNFGPLFAKGFDARLAESLRICGTEVILKETTGIDLETERLAPKIQAFKPDTMMVVSATHATVDGKGEPMNATFDVDLFESSANWSAAKPAKQPPLRAVWRSSVSFAPGRTFQPMDDGKVVADTVIERLQEDGFFPDCQPAPTEPAERADNAGQ